MALHGTFQGECFNCGQKGHRFFECKKPNQDRDIRSKSHSDTYRGYRQSRARGTFVGRGRGHLKKSGEVRLAAEDDDSEPDQKEKMFVVGLLAKELEKSAWIVDSGASRHMTFKRSWFVNYIAFRMPQKVRTANGDSIQALGYGDIVIQTILDKGTDQFTVKDVLLVPELTCSLLSVSTLLEKGMEVQFGEGKFKILDQEGKVCGQGIKSDRLFLLDCQVKIPKGHINFAVEVLISDAKVPVDLNLWHQRLGHVNELQLR